MRRTTFIRGFYERLTGLQPLSVPRRLGPLNYDTHCPYQVTGKIEAPHGLGIRDDFSFARAHADRPLRVAVQGPMTLLMPLRRGGPYSGPGYPTSKEIAVGVVDVKAFRVETPEEVAARTRLALQHVPAARLWLVPDSDKAVLCVSGPRAHRRAARSDRGAPGGVPLLLR